MYVKRERKAHSIYNKDILDMIYKRKRKKTLGK